MESIVVFIFFVVLTIMVVRTQLTNGLSGSHKLAPPKHVKPENSLYDLLRQYSSGSKLYLAGQCNVNLYTKHIIPAEMKEQFRRLLNQIVTSIYNITKERFNVQEFNNIYEQTDHLGNSRYIIDATLNAVQHYYTTRVILDIVIINGEVFINFISVNNASNNNIVDRYDVVFQDQGILFNHNNFTTNIRSLLDQEYREKHTLIAFQSKYLDSKNYQFENVLSLKSLLNNYVPATLSAESESNLQMKGVLGQVDMFFPPDQQQFTSSLFCTNQDPTCVFDHTSTATEYNQPYMAPGLFFDRSSYPRPL
jgi:hypothetical protein